ncbi:MAG: CHASE3 domain-containing protein [Alphaproteobacteria bacterium]|nr:CHASE3 domain-containing protein [Alphaproteobacteria bacterium]MDE2112177.1 CHASE3 domain-containing protein [Alphaproteobacteria bacterium]
MNISRSPFETAARLVRHGAVRPMGVQLLSVALVLLCSGALLLGLNIVDLRHQIARDRDADKIIEQLDNTANHLLGIEVAVRGYALFGNPKLLVRYRQEAGRLQAAMTSLSRLTAGLPLYDTAMAHIRDAVGVRMKIVAHVMSMAPDPPSKLALALRNVKDHGAIDAARNAVTAMRHMEVRHREQLAAKTEQEAVHNFALAAGIVLLSILVGALGVSCALLGGRTDPPQPLQATPG